MIDESAKDSGRKWDNICEEMRNFNKRPDSYKKNQMKILEMKI